MSFFKTEPIAGAFITGFFFIVSGYLIDIYKKSKKLLEIEDSKCIKKK